MEGTSKSATCFIKLNTKGCCFLCLASINQNEENKAETNSKSNSLQSLLCFLEISPGSLIGRLTNSNGLKIDKIQVDLCHACKEFQSRLSTVYRQLQQVQLEMDYVLGRIRNCILKSTENGELVQNYSKRMTSDVEALAQLAFVDILRKEIARKSLEKQFLPSPSVILNRISSNSCKDVVIKQEQADVDACESEQNQDNLFEDVWNDFNGPSTSHQISQSPLSNVETSEKKAETVAEVNARSSPPEGSQEEMQTTDKNKPTMDDLSSQLLCNSCNKGYDSLSSLQNHQRLVHSNANGFPCHLCEKKFKQKPYLTDHINSVHLGKRFYCRFCNNKYWHQCTVRTHEKNCPKNRKNTSFRGFYYRKDATTGLFHCLECETKSDKASIVKQHFESVHLKIKYKCKICRVAEFSNFKSLTEHKRQGTCRRPPVVRRLNKPKPKETNFPFNCIKCEKRFSSIKNLAYHETSVHKNVGRYPCDLCDKKFKRAGHLKDHVDGVHLNKMFPCRYCNELCKAGGAFRKHEASCPQKNKTTVKLEVNGSQE